MVLPKDGVRRLAMEDNTLSTDAFMSALAERPALALLLKKMPEREGEVIGKLLIFITDFQRPLCYAKNSLNKIS